MQTDNRTRRVHGVLMADWNKLVPVDCDDIAYSAIGEGRYAAKVLVIPRPERDDIEVVLQFGEEGNGPSFQLGVGTFYVADEDTSSVNAHTESTIADVYLNVVRTFGLDGTEGA